VPNTFGIANDTAQAAVTMIFIQSQLGVPP
jgi:hypothetical protein